MRFGKASLFLFLLVFISLSYSYEVEYDEGWNLMSTPGDTSWSTIDDNCELHSGPFEWDREDESSGESYLLTEDLDSYRGYWIQLDSGCSFEYGESEQSDVELVEGWNIVSSTGQVEIDYWYIEDICGEGSVRSGPFDENDNIVDDALEPDQGYWIQMESDCSFDPTNGVGDHPDDREGETPENGEDPIDDSYLSLEEADIVSDTVSPDESDLNVEFSFDRDSAVSNDVTADVSLHIDEGSDSVENFEVVDSSDVQDLSLDWEVLWEERSESSDEDVSVQLVLEENTEGDYRWNQDSIEAGTFDIERCSNFESNIDASEWEYDYNPEEESACLDEVSMDSTSGEDEYEFNVLSEQGVCGELEFDSTYWSTEGNEVLSIDFNTLQDVDHITDNVELEIRHFTGGPSDDAEWITIVDEDVEDIEEDEIVVEFEEASEDDLHDYNKVQIIMEGDNCSDDFEVSGTVTYEEYTEDGPGTCKAEERWCQNAGECIDEDSYEHGLCNY